MLQEAHDLGLPMVCANPDKRVKRGDKLIYCGGALAEVYEQIGGEVIYAGKPHAPIYRLARAWLEELMGYASDKNKVLVVGDNVQTDLLGAQKQGYDALFVADGLDAGNAAQVGRLLENYGLKTKYSLASLRW